MPEQARRILRAALKEVRKDGPSESSDSGGQERGVNLDNDFLGVVVRNLLFTHRGSAEKPPPFRIQDESDGTIAWLAVAVPAMEALRRGGLLLVDEIDASLHPHLVEILLEAFADPSVNKKNAQLIFTTHETHLLSPQSNVRLDPRQIWVTDKTYEGVTELACLGGVLIA